MNRPKNLNLEFYSHACVKISVGKTSVVFDPWLIGTTYWGAWELDPPASQQPESLTADAIAISHWHFDHLNLPTLRRVDKDIPVFVPRFPISWMPETLEKLGFKSINEVSHGSSVLIGEGLRVWFYQCQFQDDCCLVVDTPLGPLVNLNDAKPLPHLVGKIKRNHQHILATMRSYSPAWSYPSRFISVGENKLFKIGENEYPKRFVSESKAFDPRYLIAFASGVRHPHPDLVEEDKHRITFERLNTYVADTHPGTRLLNGSAGSRFEYIGSVFQEIEPAARSINSCRRFVESTNNTEQIDFGQKLVILEKLRGFQKIARVIQIISLNKISFRVEIYDKSNQLIASIDSRSGVSDKHLDGVDVQYFVSAEVLYSAISRNIFTNIDISKLWTVKVKTRFVKHMYFTGLYALYEHGYFGRRLLQFRVIQEWWKRRAELLDYLIWIIRRTPGS